MFVLPYEGGTVTLRQRTPLPFAEVALVTDRVDGLTIEGNGLSREERELQGRRLILVRGPGTPPGGVVALRFVGLPRGDPTWRLVAAGMTLGVLLVFGLYAARGGTSTRAQRARLEQQRDHLVGELAALERADPDAKDKKRQKKCDELIDRLTKIYRDLDEGA
jgi:hypothetical protein